MENEVEQIGDKIAKLRKENNLTQEKLAEKLDVSRQTVYQWESNAQIPKTDKLILLCKLFNKSITYFIPSTEEESKKDDSSQPQNDLDDNSIIQSTPNSHKKHKVKPRVYIILISILLLVSIIITASFAAITFTSNTGDLNGNTSNIGYGAFYTALTITIILFCLELFFIIFIVKRNANKNKTKCKPNENR